MANCRQTLFDDLRTHQRASLWQTVVKLCLMTYARISVLPYGNVVLFVSVLIKNVFPALYAHSIFVLL